MKKTIAVIVCLVMLLSIGMSTTVFADETTHTLTINNPTKDHIYEAYQIFSGTLENVSGTDTQVLTNIGWGTAIAGEGYDNSAALLAEIHAAATAAADESPMKKLLGVNSAASLAEAMADNITTDSETLDTLASIFAKHIESGKISAHRLTLRILLLMLTVRLQIRVTTQFQVLHPVTIL